jgi:preprotein translocase subunit SecF
MTTKVSFGDRLYRGEKTFNFVNNRKRWYGVSAILLIASIFALGVKGLELGIEFKGGSEFVLNKSGITVPDARSAMDKADVPGGSIVQTVGSSKVRIQTGALTNAQSTKVLDVLSSTFGVAKADIDTRLIGPSWGREITRKATTALIAFLLIIILFLSVTFEPKMAIAAIIALFHDVFITVGIYALVGFEVTPATVIGFLTILGYSLYDTVVVFDKVRENTRGIAGGSRYTYSDAANLAVNQTLVRSINTSIVALLPVAAILFVGAGVLGAGTLKDLSLALFIGLAVGTYSSICVATPFLAAMREREPAMKALAKRVSNKSGKAASTSANSAADKVVEDATRGPRNQPRRQKKQQGSGKGKKKR